VVPDAVARRFRQKLKNLDFDERGLETFVQLLQRADEYNTVGTVRDPDSFDDRHVIKAALDAIPDRDRDWAENNGATSCETLNELRAVFAELDERRATRHARQKIRTMNLRRDTIIISGDKVRDKSFSRRRELPSRVQHVDSVLKSPAKSWKDTRPSKPPRPCRECGLEHWEDLCPRKQKRLQQDQAYPSKPKAYVLEEDDNDHDEEVQGYCAEEGTSCPSDDAMDTEEEAYLAHQLEHNWMNTLVTEDCHTVRDTCRSKPVMLTATLQDKMIPVCADTGASSTFISEAMLREWYPNIPISQTCHQKVQGVGKASIIGNVTLKLSLKTVNGWRPYVVLAKVLDNMAPTSPILLGREWLESKKAILDLHQRRLILHDNIIVPFQTQFSEPLKAQGFHSSIENRCIVLKNSTSLPVGDIVRVEVQASSFGAAYGMIHMRTYELSDYPGVLVANQFHRINNSNTYVVELLNIGSKTETLPASLTLGELVPVPLEAEETPIIPLCELTTREEFEKDMLPQIQQGQDKEMTEHHKQILSNILWIIRAAFPCAKRQIGYSWYHPGVKFITGGASPKYEPRRRYSAKEMSIQNEYVEMAYKLNIVEESNSPYNYNFVMVPKKDPREPARATHNYKPLNEITAKDSYPLWFMEDILQGIPPDTRHFSAVDAVKGFLQIPIRDPQERQKTAFSTEKGHHQYKRCPMGVKNGTSIYQRDMNIRYQDYIRKFVYPFVDDLLIFSKTPMEHLKHIGLVCNRMIRDGMCLSSKKSFFFKEEVKCLGFIISKAGITPDPDKIKAIQKWSQPSNKREVKGFLGTTGFYRKFVKDYAAIAKPLRILTADNVAPEEYTKQSAKEAFQKLKEKLCTPPILRSPDLKIPFRMYTDASKDGYSCILAQVDKEKKEYVVAYYSKATTEGESKRHSTELEFGAVNWALEKCRPIIYGAQVEIITDHDALKSLLNMKTKNRRIQGMSLDLEEWRDYITVRHRAGKNNHVDALSRSAEVIQSTENDKTIGLYVEPEDWVKKDQTVVYHIQQEHEDTLRISSKFQMTDDFKKRLIQAYHKEPLWMELRNHFQDRHRTLSPKAQAAIPHYTMVDDLLYWTGNVHTCPRLCIPVDLREEICNLLHNHPFLGHLGRDRTVCRAQEYYFWPKMKQDIQKHVEQCVECQQTKSGNRSTEGKRQPLGIPLRRWGSISMDFMIGFPGVYDCLWVIVDRLTKRIRLFPIKTTTTAKELARLFLNEFVKIHGLPDEIICDRDAKFRSQFWQAFMDMLQVKLKMSTAFHPQTDGQTERMNRTIQEMLKAVVLHAKDPENWHDEVNLLEFAYNSSINSVTGMSPFVMDLGWQPKDLNAVMNGIAVHYKLQEIEEWDAHLSSILCAVQDSIALAQEKQMKEQKNLTHEIWKAGDYAWVETQNLNIPVFKEVYKKLRPKYIGPFRVVRKIGDNVAELDLPENFRIHKNFNIRRLRKCRTPEDKLPTPPTTEVLEGEVDIEYEIEKLMGHKKVRNGYQYLVKWKGYPDWESTWVTRRELLRNAHDLLHEYEKENVLGGKQSKSPGNM
jgi:hypothetical protein